MARTDWDAEAMRAKSLMAQEEYRISLQRMERESKLGGVPAELATTWVWMRCGAKGDAAAEHLAAQLRLKGYVDAPPGLIFHGDLSPERMIYLGRHTDAHREHMRDLDRRHKQRMREVMGAPSETMAFARDRGAVIERYVDEASEIKVDMGQPDSGGRGRARG